MTISFINLLIIQNCGQSGIQTFLDLTDSPSIFILGDFLHSRLVLLANSSLSAAIYCTMYSLNLYEVYRGIFLYFFFQHCFICRSSDSTVLENAGIEPRTVATLALVVSLML